MTKKDKEKLVPVDAVQELADKAAQAASIGGTDKAAERLRKAKLLTLIKFKLT
jgi:hypothetical protein